MASEHKSSGSMKGKEEESWPEKLHGSIDSIFRTRVSFLPHWNSVGTRDFQVLKLFSVLDGKPVLYSLEILLKEGYFWKILIHRVS